MGHRILLFVSGSKVPNLAEIEMFLIRNSIVRKHTDSVEIDLETMEPSKVVSFFRLNTSLKLVRRLCPNEVSTRYDRNWMLMMRDQIIDTASALFEEERYWESHVLLESLWKISTGGYRKYVQNLIYFSVSMIKYQMGEFETARKVFQKSMETFELEYSTVQGSGGVGDFRYPFPFTFPKPENIPKI
jgi:hypothetical protein